GRVPAWLLRALRRGLSSESPQRFESMEQLLRVLQRFRVKQRGRVAASIVGVALVGLGIGLHRASERQRLRSCSQGIESAWGRDVRDKAELAFRAAKLPYGLQ